MHYETVVNAQHGLNHISWAGLVDDIFLRSLLQARVFRTSGTDTNNLTDFVIEEALESQSASSMHDSFEANIAYVARSIHQHASKPDASLQALNLPSLFASFCECRGWKIIDTAQKMAVKHIFSMLHPPRLKIRIKGALQLEKNCLRKDISKFRDLFEEEAEMCKHFQLHRKYLRNNRANKKTIDQFLGCS